MEVAYWKRQVVEKSMVADPLAGRQVDLIDVVPASQRCMCAEGMDGAGVLLSGSQINGFVSTPQASAE